MSVRVGKSKIFANPDFLEIRFGGGEMRKLKQFEIVIALRKLKKNTIKLL